MSSQKQERHQLDKKGFSLIEMVLVILVVGISSVGLATAMRQALVSIHKPEVMSTAVALAEKEAERNMRLGFSAVTDEYRDAPASYAGNFSAYSRQTRVTVDPLDSNKKTVEIRVHNPAVGYVWIAFLKTNY